MRFLPAKLSVIVSAVSLCACTQRRHSAWRWLIGNNIEEGFKIKKHGARYVAAVLFLLSKKVADALSFERQALAVG